MEVRHYIEPHLNRGGVAIIISLDVQGAFWSAWCPVILQRQRNTMPQEPLLLTKDYPKERKAVMTMNNFSTQKNVTKGCPQGSFCGPGLWNIQYDILLNLQYRKQCQHRNG